MTVSDQQRQPSRQYLSPPEVLRAMHEEAMYFFHLSRPKIVVLALTAGGFITMGALFSLLLSAGVQTASRPRARAR